MVRKKILQPRLPCLPAAVAKTLAAEGSSAQLQALMTKYCVAWSTLPYCDHDEVVDGAGNEDDPSV